MPNCLEVKLVSDDDGTVGLVAEVHSGDFSGKGEAWFKISEISAFVDQLLEFAQTTKNPPSIEGGFWGDDGELSELLLSFKFYSFSNYRLGAHIVLADHPYTDCREEEVSRISVELKPVAQKVIEFCDQLKQLLLQKIDVAILECE